MARTQRGFASSANKLRNKLKNDATLCNYFEMLKHLAIVSFPWDGLPSDMDSIFIEESLFKYGIVAVFFEKDVGLVALPALISGGLDIYGKPKLVRAFSPVTGFSRLLKYSPDVNASECVLIFNTNRNLNAALFKGTLLMYAERMAEMKRTEDVNIYAQRTPITMVVPDGQVDTYTNLFDRYDNFSQLIFGYKGLDVDAIKSIKTDAPLVAPAVEELFIKTWNEAISYLGITNAGVSKRERVNNMETAFSMGSTLTFRNMRLNPREWACKLVKEKWGETWKVNFAEDEIKDELLDDLVGRNNAINNNDGGDLDVPEKL